MMTAFLPPISQTTFLTKACPSDVRPAASRMSSPTSFEPVKAISATRRSRTSAAPTVSPGAGQELQHVARAARLPEDLAQDPGDAGRLLGGLDDHRVAGDQRRDRHAGSRSPSGKFQGLMTAATPRGWCHVLVELADEPAQALALEQLGRPQRA